MNVAYKIGENNDITCLAPWLNQTKPNYLKLLADGSTVQVCDFWRPFKLGAKAKVVPLSLG